jgi:hypothetical protein
MNIFHHEFLAQTIILLKKGENTWVNNFSPKQVMYNKNTQ